MKLRILNTLLFLGLATVATAESFSFIVVGIDCAACAPPIVRALNSVEGVKNPRIDTKTSTATVDVPEGFDKKKIRAAVTGAGFGVIFPGEEGKSGIEPLSDEIVRTLDIKTDTSGQRADIDALTVPGKVTIIDFYADWCGPCRVLETRLEHLMAGSKKHLALRRVNIGRWDNEAAKQATRDLRVEALPYIRVYDTNGAFVASVTGGMWDEVLAAIEKAEHR